MDGTEGLSRTDEWDRVNEIAQEFLERHRRGERPEVTEYTDKFPELAETIREAFPAMLLMEGLGADDRPGPTPAEAPPEVAQQIGEYRILREVGRGGMGVVYEATQASLGRRVALKVLPPHAFVSEQQRERFRREAQAAARLHHTNIVPVFGTGEEGGVHYYAMQFIHGQSLDKVIEDLQALRDEESDGATKVEEASGVSEAHTAPAEPSSSLTILLERDSEG